MWLLLIKVQKFSSFFQGVFSVLVVIIWLLGWYSMLNGIKVWLKVLLIVSKVIIFALVVINSVAPLVWWWNHCLLLPWPTLWILTSPVVEICAILVSLISIAATSWLNNRQLLLFNGRFVVFIMWSSSECLILMLMHSLPMLRTLFLLLFLQTVFITVIHYFLAHLSYRIATIFS